MKRPLVISLALLGIFAVVVVLWARRGKPGPAREAHRPSSIHRSPDAARLTKTEENKIILGDLEAVPFQELYGLLSRRNSTEIAELARQLQSLPRNPKSEAQVAAFFSAWATLDATAAFNAAISFRPELRDNAIGAVLEGADASMAGSLVASISALPRDSLPANTKAKLLARAIGKWSLVDPVAAARFLDSSGERGMSFSMAWHETASNWAAIDPVAALAWAREKSKKGEQFAMSGAIIGWWKNDPRAAEAYVTSHLATLEDWQLASALAANMFNDDPERAKKWVSQLPNEDARRQAASMLAIQWGFSDPEAATKWSATLPAGERGLTLGEAVGSWARQDPQAAAQWLGGYDGVGRDEAVHNFSLNVASKDPAVALSWAASISDPKTRATAEGRIAGDWMKQNPEAATAWIQNSSLPAEEKSRLLTPAPGK